MEKSNFADEVAKNIASLGLATPAILLLEAHKPLAFLGSQLLLIVEPGLNLFLPQNFTRKTANLLADPDQLENLIHKLEQPSLCNTVGDR